MERSSHPVLALCTAVLIAAISTAVAHAAPVAVRVTDENGQALADAAVYAEPESGQLPSKVQKTIEIEQKNSTFLPMVTVIQTGTNISFPNNDNVRHNVYSFSPPKIFELKLYAGDPAHPIHFDRPGTVAIGCNIHDQMEAYIHVVPTPYFAKTDAEGKARLEGVPPGKYRLKAWHYGLPPGVPVQEKPLTVAASGAAASFNLNVKTR
jgi:plastocyanin